MKNIKYNGYTYTVYIKRKGSKIFYEVIKYVTGFRNLWNRVTIDEYNRISKLILIKK